ncbi:phage tail assembly chaperone [Stakelama tenebrarum]
MSAYFVDAAKRLSGAAGVMFGWTPDGFWNATPEELAALVRAAGGEEAAPPDGAVIARLKEQFPDG